MKLRHFILHYLMALVIGASIPASAALWQWSTTAGSNSTADPDINWAEGMAPSQVNDSARATMAAVARWRADTDGSLTGAGSATAMTLTTNAGNIAATPNDGQRFVFKPGTTTGTAPTLTVDGGTAFPVQSVGGTAVVSGAMVAGIPYEVMFSNSNSSYILIGATHICSTGLTVTTGTCTVSLAKFTNSISGDVVLSNSANFFDGPSVAQGTSGTWVAYGTVTLLDASAGANYVCKLWDGTTVMAASEVDVSTNTTASIGLSGYITSPAGNIRISCKNKSANNGAIKQLAPADSTTNASTISALRVG